MTLMPSLRLWGRLRALAWVPAALSWGAVGFAQAAGEPEPAVCVEKIELPRGGGEAPLPMTVYVPPGSGPCPVIVFSHGAGGSREYAPALMRAWAEAGFVCIVPTHSYPARPRYRPSGIRAIREIAAHRRHPLPFWTRRTGDISAILDRLAALEAEWPALAGRMDAEAIGVGGHSLGAATALLLGGARLYPGESGEGVSLGDSRIKAVLVVSGPGAGRGFRAESWEGLDVPMLVLAGPEPQDVDKHPPRWRAEPFEGAPRGNKHLLYFREATHVSYVGGLARVSSYDSAPWARWVLRRAGGQARAALDDASYPITREATTAFWRAYLLGDTAAKRRFAAESPRAWGGLANLESR